MSDAILRPGDSVELLTLPTGKTSRTLPLTIGSIYTVRHIDGSNVVTTTDEPDLDGHHWSGRVRKVS